jgi:hypothetical protein
MISLSLAIVGKESIYGAHGDLDQYFFALFGVQEIGMVDTWVSKAPTFTSYLRVRRKSCEYHMKTHPLFYSYF